jgi:hypothetical protein
MKPISRRLAVPSRPIREWSLALIGNASAGYLQTEKESRPEAFSIRRLGGSRWRLRRTRCAMGFERQFGSQELREWA